MPQNGSTAHAYITLEEAAEILQYDQSYIKTLRTKKVLKTAGRNSNLVSMASVKAALSKKQAATKKQMKGKSITTDTLVESPMNAEAMINATVAALQEKPDTTEEELRVILGLQRAESARFWKVKAQSILSQEQQATETVPVTNERLQSMLIGASTPKYSNNHGQTKETVSLDEYPELLV